ncbi:unnamed protein product [Ceratitis capitata]|uniref:(Mediterranean fruit fly) hypothetical protein n=1 Tax=Ceratitis capitata TaxID=7213 RepID=A0A811UWS7_CERCA|nr:unnamed protein product [Ceratitis capitata]
MKSKTPRVKQVRWNSLSTPEKQQATATQTEKRFGMVRAPTPIVISSDEEEEIRRGEIDTTEENSQRPGDGGDREHERHEKDHNAEEETALTLLAKEDRGLEQWLKEIADTEVQAAEPEVVDEIEKWLRQTGEPTTTPPGWRNFTNIDSLPTELITKSGREWMDQQPGNDRRSDTKREASGTAYESLEPTR